MALIHILEYNQNKDRIIVQAAFHIDVENTAHRALVAAMQATSAVPDLSEDELDDVKFGRVAEFVRTETFAPDAAKAYLKQSLENLYDRVRRVDALALLAQLTESAGVVGATFDGESWSK